MLLDHDICRARKSGGDSLRQSLYNRFSALAFTTYRVKQDRAISKTLIADAQARWLQLKPSYMDTLY